MNINDSWKNIEVPVETEAKVNHIYIANIINVETYQRDQVPMYKFFYQAVNSDGEKLTVNRSIRTEHLKNWLATHTGYDKKERQPLQKIADEPQLILIGEFNSHPFVKMVRPLENLVVRDV